MLRTVLHPFLRVARPDDWTGRLSAVAVGVSFVVLVLAALMARIPMVAAVSAASSLAVELAQSSGMALVGFLRGSSMNVYCGSERVEVS